MGIDAVERFRPRAVSLSGSEALHPSAVKEFVPAVNPSEAKGFLHGIEIPEVLFVCRPSPLNADPAFILCGMIRFEPCAKLSSIDDSEDIMFFH